ncbi:hypothetical protein [Bacillus benzoevorans]|uniref:Uncharacterized protein n=1 Tax=Bacillus benzoevorans TaxID=1456 RepID=A0A7X0HXS9_9BACI|nr:hypothetical protein [Bacillus benzoevorans]MBB6447962.1 hypothetical protein [Bacillus benzoevorans]
MPDNRRNQHVEATPHFDGEKEALINDATASGSKAMGVQVSISKEFRQNRNSLNHVPKVEEEMKEFEKLMRGNKVDN